jgi:hypothetical protein
LADGIPVTIRLEENKLCLLVLIGVRADGSKELVALMPVVVPKEGDLRERNPQRHGDDHLVPGITHPYDGRAGGAEQREGDRELHGIGTRAAAEQAGRLDQSAQHGVITAPGSRAGTIQRSGGGERASGRRQRHRDPGKEVTDRVRRRADAHRADQ